MADDTHGLADDLANANTPPHGWQLAAAWLDSLTQQNYSAHTISAYQAALWRFLHFLAQDGRFGDVLTCNKKALTAFLSERLESDNIKAASAKQELAAIRKFYAHLIAQGATDKNPATGYRLKSEPRPLPKIGDVDLISQLLDQPAPNDAANARLWVRDKAMFELMYSSGLRLSELVGLNIHDLDLNAGVVRVLGKGNKTRIAPVGSKARAAIADYLPHRDLWQEQNDPALFISERLGTRLSARAVQLRLTACADRAGIAQHLHPHLLRHCFASHLLSASGDLRAVQELLGHSDISTTQIYTQVDFDALTRVYDKAHPRANALKSRKS
ncbi:recombinase XerC [Moraxella caviae]|uniref:Tyrosine recombinase XerC n=1 Tax=Moraxella caviae TaxID=34060 RepID=A0A1S9ZZJ4_9GAMM|nr:recombinase XerC [Moraxella caviae]